MPKGDRRIITGFGVLIGLLTIVGLCHVLIYSHGQREQREKAASYEVANSSSISECRVLATNFDRLACLAKKISAEQEQERGRANLHAQQDMSTWAVALLWASGIGILVSVAGIILIYATLHETRAMTIATREIGAKQTCAYVFPDTCTITHAPEAFIKSFEIILRNLGETPAVKLSIQTNTQILVWPKSGDTKPMELYQSAGPAPAAYPPAIAGKNGHVHVDIRLPHQAAKICQNIIRKPEEYIMGGRLRYTGAIEYNDVFGRRHSSEFYYWFDLSGCIADGVEANSELTYVNWFVENKPKETDQ